MTFTVSGCPPGATCTLSQSNLAANAGSQTVTLTIQTAAVKAISREGHTPWSLALLPLARASYELRSQWDCITASLGGVPPPGGVLDRKLSEFNDLDGSIAVKSSF